MNFDTENQSEREISCVGVTCGIMELRGHTRYEQYSSDMGRIMYERKRRDFWVLKAIFLTSVVWVILGLLLIGVYPCGAKGIVSETQRRAKNKQFEEDYGNGFAAAIDRLPNAQGVLSFRYKNRINDQDKLLGAFENNGRKLQATDPLNAIQIGIFRLHKANTSPIQLYTSGTPNCVASRGALVEDSTISPILIYPENATEGSFVACNMTSYNSGYVSIWMTGGIDGVFIRVDSPKRAGILRSENNARILDGNSFEYYYTHFGGGTRMIVERYIVSNSTQRELVFRVDTTGTRSEAVEQGICTYHNNTGKYQPNGLVNTGCRRKALEENCVYGSEMLIGAVTGASFFCPETLALNFLASIAGLILEEVELLVNVPREVLIATTLAFLALTVGTLPGIGEELFFLEVSCAGAFTAAFLEIGNCLGEATTVRLSERSNDRRLQSSASYWYATRVSGGIEVSSVYKSSSEEVAVLNSDRAYSVDGALVPRD